MAVFFIVLALVAFDQGVKYWAATVLQPLQTIPIIQDVFHLTYVENQGAAFSILMNQRWLFIVLSLSIVVIIIIALKKKWVQNKIGSWSLYLIMAGAIGNLIDRIIHGYVIDLFDFRLINFAVFNVADILICCGGALFAFYILFHHKWEETDDKVEHHDK